MNPIEALLSEPFAQALGGTLLHVVWQGALIALLLAGALRVLRRHAAPVRYAAACGALALLLALPVITLCLLWPSPAETPGNGLTATVGPVVSAEAAMAPEAGALASSEASATWRQAAYATLAAVHPWLVLIWMTGVLALSMRYLAGWTYTLHLRRSGTRAVGQRWQDQLTRLAQPLGVARPVRLVTSMRVRVPTVAGWLRPVILMPVSVFTGLTPRQVEMVIAHELAHIRRHDYLVNLAQAVCETLLFYHPAVWWISERIRIEREHCCDDLVVAVCGDAFTYAEALAKMEQGRQAAPRLALAATGGSLLNRVRRLLEGPTEASPGAARWLAGLTILAALLLSLRLTSALDGMWSKAHTWIAGTEAAEQPGGLLTITTENDQGVLVETFRKDGTSHTMVMKGHIRVQMRTGSHFVVDYKHDSRPRKRANTTTFTAPLTLELWHHERKLSRWDVPDGTVVFEPSEVQSSSELVTVDAGSSMRSLQRPLAQAGYEKTALLLEELIFENQNLSVQLETLDELRELPGESSLPSLINVAERHPRSIVRNEAVQWLGRLGDADVVYTLERIAFGDRSLSVQMEALDALRDRGGLESMARLARIARTHPSAEMRAEAVQSIDAMKADDRLPLLEEIIFRDENLDVRMEALDLLKDAPEAGAVPILRKIARRYSLPDVLREEAADALEDR